MYDQKLGQDSPPGNGPEPALTTTPPSGAYLFVSFDLVNSTVFKTQSKKWPQVLGYFYRLARREAGEKIPGIQLWKYVGDEVLFFKRIDNMNALSETLEAVSQVAREVSSQLNNTFPFTKNVLFIKSSAWSAVCEYVRPEELTSGSHQGKNLIIQVDGLGWDDDRPRVDFVGPDIDIGFRVSGYAQKNLMVITANLANLLNRTTPRLLPKKMRIVAYEKLKGVWNDRHYPIVWFYDGDWSKISDAFLYDDIFKIPLIKAVCDDSAQLQNLDRLEGILEQAGQLEGSNSFIEAVEAQSPSDAIVIWSPIKEKCSEVHCVAVCFQENGKILLGKRPENKRVLAGKWEFGCSQLRFDQNFSDCLREAYRGDFGAEFATIWLDPVRSYTVEKNGRKIPGLIFVAQVSNPEDIGRNYSREKHTEIRWFDPDDLHGIVEDEYVPSFCDTVQAAVEVFRKTNRGRLLRSPQGTLLVSDCDGDEVLGGE